MNYLTFTQELEQKLGLTELPEEAKEMIFQKLGENILERTLLTIVGTLSEEEAGEVNAMFKEGRVEEVMNLLSEKHPELDEKIAIISNDVVREFLEGTKS